MCQSHVQVSFDAAEYTANADAIGTLRLGSSSRCCATSTAVASEIENALAERATCC
jgi:GDP-D-mannose dehydratase